MAGTAEPEVVARVDLGVRRRRIARKALPAELADRVTHRAASANSLAVVPSAPASGLVPDRFGPNPTEANPLVRVPRRVPDGRDELTKGP